jgi:hypothetical protein
LEAHLEEEYVGEAEDLGLEVDVLLRPPGVQVLHKDGQLIQQLKRKKTVRLWNGALFFKIIKL